MCLSKEYINNYTLMEWKCSVGHTWKATFTHVKNNGSWCPKCSGMQKHSIEDCVEIANKREGKCLSDTYVRNDHYLLWECKQGHKWKATFNQIQQTWCPECDCKQKYKKYVEIHWRTKENLICTGLWEKNVVRYLNYNEINYEWQSKKFKTPILTKMGKNSTYCPDLFLTDKNIWVEIKGIFLKKISEQKWNWFHKEFPNSELWDGKKLKELKIPLRGKYEYRTMV